MSMTERFRIVGRACIHFNQSCSCHLPSGWQFSWILVCFTGSTTRVKWCTTHSMLLVFGIKTSLTMNNTQHDHVVLVTMKTSHDTVVILRETLPSLPELKSLKFLAVTWTSSIFFNLLYFSVRECLPLETRAYSKVLKPTEFSPWKWMRGRSKFY